jgi:gamma-glutamyltranspeptidase/glutathione hydrolase
MEAVQAHRTPEFTNGLADPAYVAAFVATHLGNTTHISVDGRRRARGDGDVHQRRGLGVVVPGTGVHVNNIMGEEDLSPAGFHLAPPGTRMPSMMAPTVVLRDGEVESCSGPPGRTGSARRSSR